MTFFRHGVTCIILVCAKFRNESLEPARETHTENNENYITYSMLYRYAFYINSTVCMSTVTMNETFRRYFFDIQNKFYHLQVKKVEFFLQ